MFRSFFASAEREKSRHKVADYAKTIEREAEKVLGAKGSMMSAINEEDSYFSMRLRELHN